MANKKIIDKLMEPRPTITIVKPKYPNYAFQIFTGLLTLLLFQIIIYNKLQGIPVDTGEKVATLVLLIIFGIQTLINMWDEKHNRRVL